MRGNDIYSITATEGLGALNFTTLIDTYRDFEYRYPRKASEMKCHPDVYQRLKESEIEEEGELIKKGVVRNPINSKLSTIYGLKVIVDPTMQPGTWKFIDAQEGTK